MINETASSKDYLRGEARLVAAGLFADRLGGRVVRRDGRFLEEGLHVVFDLAPGWCREHRLRDLPVPFDQSAVNRVSNIRYLLDAGLTLEDVAHFRYCLDEDLQNTRAAEPLLDVGWRRLAVLDERIAGLVRVRDYLADRLAAASSAPLQPGSDLPARAGDPSR